jgi:hypothetical protein
MGSILNDAKANREIAVIHCDEIREAFWVGQVLKAIYADNQVWMRIPARLCRIEYKF